MECFEIKDIWYLIEGLFFRKYILIVIVFDKIIISFCKYNKNILNSV